MYSIALTVALRSQFVGGDKAWRRAAWHLRSVRVGRAEAKSLMSASDFPSMLAPVTDPPTIAVPAGRGCRAGSAPRPLPRTHCASGLDSPFRHLARTTGESASCCFCLPRSGLPCRRGAFGHLPAGEGSPSARLPLSVMPLEERQLLTTPTLISISASASNLFQGRRKSSRRL